MRMVGPGDGLTQAVSMRYEVGVNDLKKFLEFLVKENPDNIERSVLEKTYTTSDRIYGNI